MGYTGHQMRQKEFKNRNIYKKTSISVKYTCIFCKVSIECTFTFSMGAKRFIFGLIYMYILQES